MIVGGHYVYILFREDDVTPFYVGMSRRDSRISEHVYFAKTSKKNSRKRSILRKVLRIVGHVPFILAAQGLSKAEAKRTERSLIARFGRYPNGPLVNANDGGDGYEPTDADRAKISAALKGRIFSDTHKAAISAAKMGHVQLESTRKKISETRLARGSSAATIAAGKRMTGTKRPEAGIAIGNALRGVPKTLEHIAAARAAMLASPKWAAYVARRGSRKGDSAPPPVEA